MKTILLVRHAKSDWNDPSLNDFDRPLNERGRNDAPMMAQRLLKKKSPIELFVASPAKRARKTACIFAKEYKKEKEDVVFYEELYAAPAYVFFDVIEKTDDRINHIALFAHNPGITDFANQLTTARIDNIPTCGIFALSADCSSWSDFRQAEKHFLFFDFPKSAQ